MAFNYFLGDGFQGQDFHVLRNGQTLSLSNFFRVPTGGAIAYTFGIPGTGNRTYGNITVGTSGTVSASTYVTSADIKLDNFYITVTVTEAGVPNTHKFLLHIHDSISKIWLSPSPMTLRENFDDIRFGVFAKFNDGVVANLTWYTGYSWAQGALPAYLTINTSTGRITKTPTGTWPTTAPSSNFNVPVTLPALLQTTGGPTTASGDIKVSIDKGELFLISGNPAAATTRKNVIVLADGFTTADRASFTTFTNDIVKTQLNQSAVTLPWKLFKDSINYWGYFVASREGGGILDGDYIQMQNTATNGKVILVPFLMKLLDGLMPILQTNLRHNSVPVTINGTPMIRTSIQKDGNGAAITITEFRTQILPKAIKSEFATVLDAYIDWTIFGAATTTFPLIAPVYTGGSTRIPEANILGFQWMYDNLGLPGGGDAAKSISTKRNDAVALGIPTFKVQGDTSIPAGSKYLSSFVYKMWLKMIDRTSLAYPDTPFGAFRANASNLYIHSIRNRQSKISLNIGLAPLTYSYTDKVTHVTTSIPVGAQFFTAGTGMPILDPVDNKPVNGSNILLLSRTPTLQIGGANTNIQYPVSGHQIEDHMTVVPIYEGDTVITTTIQNVTGNTDSVIAKNMPLTGMGFYAKNALVHEFSHNYLKDEYTNYAKDLSTLTPAFQDTLTNQLLKSNLQTKKDLTDKAALHSNGIGDNIKWLWPRIAKVAVSTAGMTPVSGGAADEYWIEVGKIAPSTAVEFADHEKVLIRKKDLFDATYPVFEVLNKDPSNSKRYKVKLQAGSSFTIGEYGAGTLMILPIWKVVGTEYLKLVHKDVVAKINTNSTHSLVEIDTNYANHDPQTVSVSGLPNTDILTKFSSKQKIVGLYGGGHMEYNAGIYHPTGFCLMRKTQDKTPNYLCHVCRYIVVDNMDPLQHPAIDTEYGKDYPA